MGRKKNIVELTLMSPEQFRASNKLPLRIMADNVRSLYNIGSLFRVSDVFRVDCIYLAGITGRPPHPEISKTALGAEDTVEWRYVEDAQGEVENLKREGWRICALEQAHDSISLPDFHPCPEESYLLVIGNEVHGVAQHIVDIADVVIEIPQYGTKHSLNVSSSAAIAIYSFAMNMLGMY